MVTYSVIQDIEKLKWNYIYTAYIQIQIVKGFLL